MSGYNPISATARTRWKKLEQESRCCRRHCSGGSSPPVTKLELTWDSSKTYPNDDIADLIPADYEITGFATLPDGRKKPMLFQGIGDDHKFVLVLKTPLVKDNIIGAPMLPTAWLNLVFLFLITLFPPAVLNAQPVDNTPDLSESIIETKIGVTRSGTPILALITADDLDIHSKKLRLLIVAGLDGSPDTVAAATNMVKRYYTEPQFEPLRKVMAISAIASGNPDGLALQLQNENGAGGNPALGYPPADDAYSSLTNPEAQYIWRWIGMHAPDEVLELVPGTKTKSIDVADLPLDSLAVQLMRQPACNVGTIEASVRQVEPGDTKPLAEIEQAYYADIAEGLKVSGEELISKARLELQARDHRSPLDVCDQLAKVYGHELPTVAYIPAVACIARLRLTKLTKDATVLPELENIAADYRDGRRATLTDKSTGSDIAGHLLWGELFDATQNRRYLEMAKASADRAFSDNGQPLEAMPNHDEMSDSVFMGCPILAQVGRLTGESKYFDMCLKHMHFMLKLNLRSDGLHRHSPLDETAWGRGNGFPTLGLAWALDEIPETFSQRSEMLVAFQAHLKILLLHQDVTGVWHQVIDHPESYRELTATCMITYAMIRGVRRGWLDEEQFAPAIRKGWTAIKARIANDGSLVDVCTGTGKMKSLRQYLDRTAILGRDARGGAMALLVATEMAQWQQPQTK